MQRSMLLFSSPFSCLLLSSLVFSSLLLDAPLSLSSSIQTCVSIQTLFFSLLLSSPLFYTTLFFSFTHVSRFRISDVSRFRHVFAAHVRRIDWVHRLAYWKMRTFFLTHTFYSFWVYSFWVYSFWGYFLFWLSWHGRGVGEGERESGCKIQDTRYKTRAEIMLEDATRERSEKWKMWRKEREKHDSENKLIWLNH